MEVFFVVLIVMLCVVAMMSVGVMFGRKPIGGSCGGIAALFGQAGCAVCDKTKKKNSPCAIKIKPRPESSDSEPNQAV
jgi:hypothetical protein